MKIFGANISHEVSDFLDIKLNRVTLFEVANALLFDLFGIKLFFHAQDEFDLFNKTISSLHNLLEEPDRAEYGDFQTNLNLAKAVTILLKNKKLNPNIVVEPTCGKGNFIVASLEAFPNAKKVIGVEIYKPYIWETKFNIVQYYIENPPETKPDIEIYHFNVFDFDFKSLSNQHFKEEILIIGNPPWVTNAKLSSLESKNVPKKSNFKKHNGLDAITGKGNFDIGEYITLMLFDAFQNSNGHMAFLLKNAVIKNLVFDQKQNKYRISDLQKYAIDSKKEFNVSVEAALLFCTLNSQPEFICTEFNFYNHSRLSSIPALQVGKFGWVNDKFASNIYHYNKSNDIDGVCPFEWRQGIKHDLSSIMELERVNTSTIDCNGHFVNGLHQEVNLEENLVYGVLKSSDLKQAVINKTRKFTIITQKKVGQDTSYIKKDFPLTFNYLYKNKSKFDQRKSSIYNNKPDFSIFGIGDYSFAPFKIAISGLYKIIAFSLILPHDNKPIMLDDTCYLLGFNILEFAVYTHILMNSDKTKELLKSITFTDAKRVFTKDILMRIDLYKLASKTSEAEIQKQLNHLNIEYFLNVKIDKWNDFIHAVKPVKQTLQLNIFA